MYGQPHQVEHFLPPSGAGRASERQLVWRQWSGPLLVFHGPALGRVVGLAPAVSGGSRRVELSATAPPEAWPRSLETLLVSIERVFRRVGGPGPPKYVGSRLTEL